LGFVIEGPTKSETTGEPTVETIVVPTVLAVKFDTGSHALVRFMALMSAANSVETMPVAGSSFFLPRDYT
jgi:hypothetical protein